MMLAAALPSSAHDAAPKKKLSSKTACKLELKRLGKSKFTTRYGSKRNVSRSMRRCIGSKLSKKNSIPTKTTNSVSSKTIVENPTTPAAAETVTSTTNVTPTTFNNGTTTTQSVDQTQTTEVTSDRLCTADPFYYRGAKASGCVIKFARAEGSEAQLTSLGERLGFTSTVLGSMSTGSDIIVTFTVTDGLSAAQFEAVSGDSSVSYLEPNSIVGT